MKATAKAVMCLVLIAGSTARAGFDVTQHTSGIHENVHWVKDVIEHRITIVQEPSPSTLVFHFTATDPDDDDNLTYIDRINTNLSTATLHVQVGSSGAGNQGATAVKQIDIDGENITSVIEGIYITGDFLENAPMTVDQVTGEIYVEGALYNPMEIRSGVSQPITMGGIARELSTSLGDAETFHAGAVEYVSASALREPFPQVDASDLVIFYQDGGADPRRAGRPRQAWRPRG